MARRGRGIQPSRIGRILRRSIATEFASETRAYYAPTLDIVGVAEGGILSIFPQHRLRRQSGFESTWSSGLMLASVRGFDTHDIDKFLSPRIAVT